MMDAANPVVAEPMRTVAVAVSAEALAAEVVVCATAPRAQAARTRAWENIVDMVMLERVWCRYVRILAAVDRDCEVIEESMESGK